MSLDTVLTQACLLQAAPAKVTEAQVLDVLRRCYGLSASLERMGGERDLNFRVMLADGSSCLLKMSHPLESPEVVDFHNQAMRLIEQRDPDLPVQRVYPSLNGEFVEKVEIGGQPMLVRLLSFVDGLPLHRVGHTSPLFRQNLGHALARFDIALEGFNHPAAGHVLLWDMQHAERMQPLLHHIEQGALRDQVRRRLECFEEQARPRLSGLRKQVIHNDMNPHNIIVDPDQPDVLRNILDFGDMVHAPRVNDVAVAASYQLGRAGDVLEPALDMIGAYHRVNPLGIDELELLPVLISTRVALSLCINFWRADLHPDNREYILRNSYRARDSLMGLAEVSDAQIHDRIVAACRQKVSP
ncbi:phosphotransferase [Pseudomonas sp. NPDC090201]|uniref:phosphotransferase n=1 Tax=Pseudomonas sp. NPDC090201 TaxID=3364475 RepID=UPI0038117D79